jgi:U4/U6 small nuclear ribonucleoprotein PRP4
MVWDIRIGQPIMGLHGHYKQILSSEFHSDGYQLATGSQDNSIRIWDLRKKTSVANIPAHTKLISDVHFEKDHSRFLYSCSYDGTFKVFSTIDWTEHFCQDCSSNRLSSVSLSKGADHIFLTSMDKKVFIYEAKSLAREQANLHHPENGKMVDELQH